MQPSPRRRPTARQGDDQRPAVFAGTWTSGLSLSDGGAPDPPAFEVAHSGTSRAGPRATSLQPHAARQPGQGTDPAPPMNRARVPTGHQATARPGEEQDDGRPNSQHGQRPPVTMPTKQTPDCDGGDEGGDSQRTSYRIGVSAQPDSARSSNCKEPQNQGTDEPWGDQVPLSSDAHVTQYRRGGWPS